jgi:hypothetical protein
VSIGFQGCNKPSSDTDSGSAGGEGSGHRVGRTDATGGYDGDLYNIEYLPKRGEKPKTPAHMSSRFDPLGRDQIAASPFGGNGLLD